MAGAEKKNIFNEGLLEYRTVEKKKLILSLCVTLAVMVAEFLGGIFTNSIALLSDAGHMLTHCFAITLGLVAILIAKNPACHHRTFGLYRAEIMAAFINGLFLLLIVGVIVYKAVLRIIFPEEVLTVPMLLIALLGLLANLASIFILHGHHRTDLNVRSVFYHMVADALSSVGVVAAAVLIMIFGIKIIDPLVSLGISGLIFIWAWGILRQSGRVLLEMTPEGLNIETLSADLKTRFPEIKELFNVHLWAITTNMFVFSAHLQLRDSHCSLSEQEQLAARINAFLASCYSIIESTLQFGSLQSGETCNITQVFSKSQNHHTEDSCAH